MPAYLQFLLLQLRCARQRLPHSCAPRHHTQPLHAAAPGCCRWLLPLRRHCPLLLLLRPVALLHQVLLLPAALLQG
jgi:hypothetical protein